VTVTAALNDRWTHDLSDEDILRWLLVLNLGRVCRSLPGKALKNGHVFILRWWRRLTYRRVDQFPTYYLT